MKKTGLDIYKGKNKQWYWRFRASNGKIIADGGEGYHHKMDLWRAVRDLADGIKDAWLDHKERVSS